MRAECQNLLDSLSEIPPEELQVVKQTITAYLSVSNGSKSGVISQPQTFFSSEEGLLVDALLSTMQSLGLQVRSVRALSASSVFKSNWDKAHTVTSWASQVKDRMSRRLLYEMALKHLYRYLCEGIPVRWDPEKHFLTRHKDGVVGVREMLIFLDYAPSVMESLFPGYRESGLLHLIPKSRGLYTRS